MIADWPGIKDAKFSWNKGEAGFICARCGATVRLTSLNPVMKCKCPRVFKLRVVVEEKKQRERKKKCDGPDSED